MIISNLSFILIGSISPTATTGDTFNISNDIELDAPINTDGKVVSIVINTTRQIERMTVTILDSVCTIVKRGISQSGGTEVAGLKKQWSEGASGYITALDFDMIDKDGESQSITAPIVFNNSADFKNKLNVPEFANTTARNAVYISPVDGDICFIKGDGLQVYNGGAWGTLGVATPTSNASTTVAGKGEVGTDAEVTARTETGGTGATLFATLVQLGKSILLKPTITSTTDSDYFVVNQSGLDNKITQENIREQLAGSTTKKGTFEMATDTEANTGTDQVRVINAKQLQDKFDNIFDIIVSGFDSTQAGFIDTTFNFVSGVYLQVLTTTPQEGVYNICISDNYMGASAVTAVRIKKNGNTIIEYLYTDLKLIFGWQGYKRNGFIYPITCNGSDVITIEQIRGVSGFNYAADVNIRYSLLNTN